MDHAIDHSLETVCDASDDHFRIGTDETVAGPLLTADHALEQEAARAMSESGLGEHWCEAIADDLPVHRNDRRLSAEARELIRVWKILAHRTRITPTPALAKLPGRLRRAKGPVEKTWRTYP